MGHQLVQHPRERDPVQRVARVGCVHGLRAYARPPGRPLAGTRPRPVPPREGKDGGRAVLGSQP
jgi:hypothetical protein